MEKGSSTENYYDILNVRRDCSNKDIKTAYVQLSKKFHPDVNSKKTDSQQRDNFLKIAEAYQTLSKPKLRIEYDKNLKHEELMRTNEESTSDYDFKRRLWEIKPNYNPNPGPYYGIRGLNKTTNAKVALVLLALGIFGAVLGFTSVKRTYSLEQKRLDDLSAKAEEHHKKIISEAKKYSKNEQIQRVIDRIASRAER